ncbi:DUF1963 domain-containing protein [Streptomyces sp. LaBMicrA B280]|uniref:DUF1963 domain-containing protein n=1 Tax=Streptomyces sp. LaBMicrA B280 TaxID=3391001 RepID=UPI003BA5C775
MRSMEPFRDEARNRGIPEDEVERWLSGTLRPRAMLGRPGQRHPDGPVAGRVGGLPPMPEGEPVPNLPFLASVDLAALAPGATDLPLPKDGTLLFFANTEIPWGDADWSRLVYVPAGTPVSERAPEDNSQPHPAHDLYLTIDPSLPNRAEDTGEFPHSEALSEVWWETSDQMQTSGPLQIGGYPWVWNNDPTDAPGDWVLLAEIGGDLVEGDLGRVYWVIRQGDLANGHFDQASACYDMAG